MHSKQLWYYGFPGNTAKPVGNRVKRTYILKDGKMTVQKVKVKIWPNLLVPFCAVSKKAFLFFEKTNSLKDFWLDPLLPQDFPRIAFCLGFPTVF